MGVELDAEHSDGYTDCTILKILAKRVGIVLGSVM